MDDNVQHKGKHRFFIVVRFPSPCIFFIPSMFLLLLFFIHLVFGCHWCFSSGFKSIVQIVLRLNGIRYEKKLNKQLNDNDATAKPCLCQMIVIVCFILFLRTNRRVHSILLFQFRSNLSLWCSEIYLVTFDIGMSRWKRRRLHRSRLIDV